MDLHRVHCLYADPRQRKCDIRDMLMTANVLGLAEKYQMVFRVLNDIAESCGG